MNARTDKRAALFKASQSHIREISRNGGMSYVTCQGNANVTIA